MTLNLNNKSNNNYIIASHIPTVSRLSSGEAVLQLHSGVAFTARRANNSEAK